MKSVKYIDMAIAKTGLKNDFALSKQLGWSSGAISMYRSGKRVMDENACLALALLLSLTEHETMQLLMAAGIDRAEKAGQQSLWSVFSQRMAGVAATVAMASAVTLFLTPQNAEARTYSPASAENSYQIYIMSN